MATTVDVRNNDYIVAKKVSHDGKLLMTYGGTCGHPAMSQARQSIVMQMASILPHEDDVTPIPPQEPSIIRILHEDLIGEPIKSPIERKVELHQLTVIQPDRILNYEHRESWLDGELSLTPEVVIPDPQPAGHEVLFKYEDTATCNSSEC